MGEEGTNGKEDWRGKKLVARLLRGRIDCVSLKWANLEQIPKAMDDTTRRLNKPIKMRRQQIFPQGDFTEGRKEDREEEGDLRLKE